MQQCTTHKAAASDGTQVVVIGDDRDRLEEALDEFTSRRSIPGARTTTARADGGRSVEASVAGGRSEPISRTELDDYLSDEDVVRAVLAFQRGDRERFFRILRACREHGTEAVVPANQAKYVLVDEHRDEWVVADVEPLSPRQRRLKRLFDVAFASIGLLGLAPLIVIIALAIKLDSPGPVLYRQRRSGLFGEPFLCSKFRTMDTGSENAIPQDDTENDRITPVGHVLRKTHMDEIPQLWPILRGEMSAVGPRAAWVKEEQLLENDVEKWRKRWFVKPGLTGLAQINEVSSTDGATKLQYDLEYLQRQSFRSDVRIVAVQIAMVLSDLVELLRRWQS